MRVAAKIEGVIHWWNGQAWDTDESLALQHSKVEAERRLRIQNTNNRFLDRDEQVEAYIAESR